MRSKFSFIIALTLVVGAVSCFTSCRTHKDVIKETIIQTDTIHERYDSIIIKERIVKVEVPVPVVQIEKVVPADTTSVIETDLYKSTAWIANGMLHHFLQSLPDAKLTADVSVFDKEANSVERDQSFYKERNDKKEIVEVNKLTKTQIFLVGSGKVLWCLIGIFILFFAIKFTLEHYGVLTKK